MHLVTGSRLLPCDLAVAFAFALLLLLLWLGAVPLKHVAHPIPHPLAGTPALQAGLPCSAP